MKSPLKKAHITLIIAATLIFTASLFTTYYALALTSYVYYTERVYTTPSLAYGPESNNSTVGGEAFVGESAVDVFIGPEPGATAVPRDAVIYVFQARPVTIDLHLSPATSIARTTEEEEGFSQTTTLYPAELLQPATTYNVSGTISGLSAWWTFTTGLETAQPRTERILLPHVWWIAIAVATVVSAVFTVVWQIRRSRV